MASHNPHTLVGTETLSVRSSFVDQEFQLSIALPFALQSGTQGYPVIYVLDANFFFGSITEMTRLMAACGEFPDTIIVGIGYPVSPPVDLAYDVVSGLRTRDLTPVRSEAAEAEVLASSPKISSVESGKAEDFYQFMIGEAIPLIEQNYPVDPYDRTLAGHSWGGTFGLYTLFRGGGHFNKYIVCSPDLAIGNRWILDIEKAFSAFNEDLPVHLFLSQGGGEESNLNSEFVQTLKSRNYPSLVLDHESIGDTHHCSSPLPSFNTGLRAVFSDFTGDDNGMETLG